MLVTAAVRLARRDLDTAALGLAAENSAAEEAEVGVCEGAAGGGAAPGERLSVERVVGFGQSDEFVDAGVRKT